MPSCIRPILFFLLCIITAGELACTRSRQASQTTAKCPSDLFAIRSEQNAPVRFTVVETECPNPYFAKVDFRVESANARPISQYQVHMFTSYGGPVENDTSTSVTMMQPLDSKPSSDEMRSDSLGVSLRRGWFSDPKALLTLRVTSVTSRTELFGELRRTKRSLGMMCSC